MFNHIRITSNENISQFNEIYGKAFHKLYSKNKHLIKWSKVFILDINSIGLWDVFIRAFSNVVKHILTGTVDNPGFTFNIQLWLYQFLLTKKNHLLKDLNHFHRYLETKRYFVLFLVVKHCLTVTGCLWHWLLKYAGYLYGTCVPNDTKSSCIVVLSVNTCRVACLGICSPCLLCHETKGIKRYGLNEIRMIKAVFE